MVKKQDNLYQTLFLGECSRIFYCDTFVNLIKISHMSFFKNIRKKIKSTFFFNIIQNFFFKPQRSYSENFGEDLFVKNYFENKVKDFYVDVGCNQPKINSLTYFLHKKGWTGLNLDISGRCIQLYDYFRKKDINLNVSIGSNEKYVQSFIFYDNCTMNTVNDSFKEFTKKSINKAPEIKKIIQKTMDKILFENQVEQIDYLNIDVEGNELNVLKGFNIKRFCPQLVSIEIHDKDCPPTNNDIYKFFKKNGYNLVSIYGWTYFFEYKRNNKIHFDL